MNNYNFSLLSKNNKQHLKCIVYTQQATLEKCSLKDR